MGWKIALVLVGISFSVSAQEVEKGERAGLVQVTGSIYPTFMLGHAVTNNYVGGQLGYYFTDKYSFRGDAFVYIGSQTEAKYINDHLLIEAGFFRHFSHKRFDGFVGFSPGLSGIQISSVTQRRYQPTIDVSSGLKFHVSSYFYFFAEVHYQHLQDPWKTIPLDQGMISGGLGLQLPLKKVLNHIG